MGNKALEILEKAINEANQTIVKLKNAVEDSCNEPAEPVVLSAEEVAEMVGGFQLDKDRFIQFGKTMHQNGRLERDLELRALVDAIKEIDWKSGMINFPEDCNKFLAIYHQLKNFKPLNQD